MKILQLDVEEVEFELVKPEAKTYEKYDEKVVKVVNALLLFISIEKGDGIEEATRAVNDAVTFAKKQKVSAIVMYPFAHLSGNLEKPDKALEILVEMRKLAADQGVKIVYSPFGWNKKFRFQTKGHPLAETLRQYGAKPSTTAATPAPDKPKHQVDLSIVKKSDWSGLPATDHRTIGEQLDLYSFQEISPGMTYWHPNGYIIFKELMKYIREKLVEYRYKEIATPAFANLALWHVSGHYDHYKDNMFILESDDNKMGLKPMNCPSTMMVYKSRKWSYRDFPIRFADFDKLYRNEISGALTGLFRVREMTQDDAHIFVTEDQIESEISSILKLVNELYSQFNLQYSAKLSTMPDDHMGDEKFWIEATDKLKHALNKNKMKFEIKDKEGAFYGPKIDFDVKDSMGREWQCATIQLDYQLPQRFKLEYTGADGKEHTPVVIHRVIFGSLERFIGVMVEHYQGKFPTWIAPVQVKVMTISEQANDYAQKVYRAFEEKGIRVELDVSDRTIDYKVREAQMMKIPYMIVVGQKEVDAGTVAVRNRAGKQKFGVKLDSFIDSLLEEIKKRGNTEMQM